MNSTKLTQQQLGDLKREFASVMVGDMTPKELFEFAVHRVLCDVATMKQDELKDHISEYDEFHQIWEIVGKACDRHGIPTDGDQELSVRLYDTLEED